MSFLWFESAFEREERETRELFLNVKALTLSFYAGDENFLENIILDITSKISLEETRFEVCDILFEIFQKEGSFSLLNEMLSLKDMSESERINYRNFLRRKQKILSYPKKPFEYICSLLRYLIHSLFEGLNPSSRSVIFIPLYQLTNNLDKLLDTLAQNLASDEFGEYDIFYADRKYLLEKYWSGKKFTFPSDLNLKDNAEILEEYFEGTLFFPLFLLSIPYEIENTARSEHTHILGGTGHGKTELLKLLIHHDFMDVAKKRRSILIMDSQGDMINSLLSLEHMNSVFKENIVIIDPSELEFPTALNLFSLNTNDNNALQKEGKILSAVSLYTYLFSELLGAELTARQGATFSFLARLMIEIKGATIHTLLDLLENGEKYKIYMEKLEGSAYQFFKVKFFSASFTPVKTQIANRLWAILGNSTLDRLFSHTESKIDIFQEFQSSKIIFVNTAKSFLKEEASNFFGKFILSLVSHSMIERANIPHKERLPVSIYIDEANEYLDNNLASIIAQSRKYGISITLAHQSLDQLSEEIKSLLISNTRVKFAGGISYKDALSLRGDMRTSSDFLMQRRKQEDYTDFALFIKNNLSSAVSALIPLGHIDKYTKQERDELIHFRKYILQKYGAKPESISYKTETPQSQETVEIPKPKAIIDIPKTEGKGGHEHKYLQTLIKSLAEKKGYIAHLEYKTEGGFIDIFLKRGEEEIAIEIAIHTDIYYELKNLDKCLKSTAQRIFIVSTNAKHLANVQRLAKEAFTPLEQSRISFLKPEEVIEHLSSPLEHEESITTKTSKGYKITIKRASIDEEESVKRRKAVGEILRRGIKK